MQFFRHYIGSFSPENSLRRENNHRLPGSRVDAVVLHLISGTDKELVLTERVSRLLMRELKLHYDLMFWTEFQMSAGKHEELFVSKK